MTDKFPLLPPHASEFKPRWPGDIGGFTEQQMRAYADAARADALEQAAQSVFPKHPQWCECRRCHDAPQIAAAIRDLNQPKSPTIARHSLVTDCGEAGRSPRH